MTDAVQESWEQTLRERPEFARRVETGPAYRACLERDNPEAYKRLLTREAAMSPPYVHGVDMSTVVAPEQTVDMCEACGEHPRAAQRRLCWGCIKRRQRLP